jgi:hypothetical protein
MTGLLRNRLAQFREDLRAPIAEAEGQPRLTRLKLRARRLLGKYGWKLVLGVFLFYLIRDLALYVLLPYLALMFVM